MEAQESLRTVTESQITWTLFFPPQEKKKIRKKNEKEGKIATQTDIPMTLSTFLISPQRHEQIILAIGDYLHNFRKFYKHETQSMKIKGKDYNGKDLRIWLYKI